MQAENAGAKVLAACHTMAHVHAPAHAPNKGSNMLDCNILQCNIAISIASSWSIATSIAGGWSVATAAVWLSLSLGLN
jgi:hypothetical protein